MNKENEMSVEQNAGNAILALSTSSGVANWLAQADTAISVVVGILSAVGIVYSIIWHRVRIKQARDKRKRVVTPTPTPSDERPFDIDDEPRGPDGRLL